MGAVYRARRRHIGDEVAIKVLLDKFVAGSEATERFRREARAAAMLRHPNVVAIHDFSDGAGASSPAYIVMELVEGRSLRHLLDQEGRIAAERLRGIILSAIRLRRPSKTYRSHWASLRLTYGSIGAAIAMLPFVLLRTTMFLLPVGVAILGLVAGLSICGIKILIQRFARRTRHYLKK